MLDSTADFNKCVAMLSNDDVSTSQVDFVQEARRSHLASRVLILSMAVTVLIGVAEITFWFFSRNDLFLIEGIGNLLWLVPDLMMLVTIRLASRKPDWKMNYGYRRIETLFLLLFSLSIAGFALFLLYGTITQPPEQFPLEYGQATVILSVVIIAALLFLSQYIWNVGKKIGSRLLLLDSTIVRLDAACAVILLLSGIFLVFAPSALFLQVVLNVLVELGLIYCSVKEAIRAAKELIDVSPSLEVLSLIEKITEEFTEVYFISDQRLRSFGGAIAVDLTLETAPDMTIQDAYRLTVSLEDKILSSVKNVFEVQIRVNPAGTYLAKELEFIKN